MPTNQSDLGNATTEIPFLGNSTFTKLTVKTNQDMNGLPVPQVALVQSLT